MSFVHKHHVLLAGPLPSALTPAKELHERFRDAGLTVSHADSLEDAGRHVSSDVVDVLVVAAGGDGAQQLISVAGDSAVPCCAVGDETVPGVDTTLSLSGPSPVARLIGVVHELTPRPDRDEESGAPGRSPIGERTSVPPSTARVLDEAPVGITVADVTHPDQPLVYVNDKFVEQTGYDREIAIGRNCRFLQGPATEEEPVTRMREAIDAEEPVRVELRNYDWDGNMFWQEVSLAPIRDDAGAVTHYAGFQNDITQRKRAEQAAERHRTALAEERETLRTLLDRLDGLVEHVTGAVVEAESRTALGESACARLGATYAAAWLATYDPASERIDPEWSTVSTLDADPADSLGSVSIPDNDSEVAPDGGTALDSGVDGAEPPEPALLATAIAERTVAVAEDGRWRSGVGEVAAVPVTYRGTVFGVFCVYTDAAMSLGREERAVLSAIGRTIGVGLNAIDSHSSLTTDSGFEVEFTVGAPTLPLVQLADRADCSLRQAGVVPGDDGPTVLCTGVDVTAAELREAADAVAGVRSCRCIAERAENPLFAFALGDSPLLDAVGTHGLRLADLQVDASGVTVVARGQQEAGARSLVDELESEYGPVDVRGFRDSPARETTLTEFVVDVEERLTDRQQQALTTAVAAGYFEWPRETDGDELAASFGVARSTFHQHLRAALRKLLAAFDDAIAR